jgi:hypothetical protein
MAKFPHVTVKLTGRDGNAFAIIGAVVGAMRKANVSKHDIDLYTEEAMSGDYNQLLFTTTETVNVE